MSHSTVEPSQNYTKLVVRGVGVSILATILAAFFGYIFRILLTRGLSVDEYGAFYSVMALFSILGFAQDLGLRFALVRDIPIYRAKGDSGVIKHLLMSTFSIWFGLSLLLVVLVISFSNVIAVEYLKDPSFASGIVAYSILFLLFPLDALFRLVFQGFQKIEYISLIELLKPILISILTFFLFTIIGYTILAPIIAYIITYTFLTLLVEIPLVYKLIPSIITVRRKKDSSALYSLFTFGFQSSIVGVIESILVYTDIFMITILSNLTQVGYYTVSLPTAKLLWKFTTALSQVLLPLVSFMWAKGDKEKLRDGLKLVYKYSFIIMLPSAISLLVHSKILLLILFGTKYVQATSTLQILSLGAIVIMLSKISINALISMGHIRIVQKVTIFSGVTNVLGNLLLIPLKGSEGAALATLFASIILFVASQIYLHRILPGIFHNTKIHRIILSGFLFFFSLTFLRDIFHIESIVGVAISTVLSCLLYMLVIFMLKIITIQEVVKTYLAVSK